MIVVMSMLMSVIMVVVMVSLAGTVVQILENRGFDAHGAFHLEGRVGNMEPLKEKFFDVAQNFNLVCLLLRFHIHMRRQG